MVAASLLRRYDTQLRGTAAHQTSPGTRVEVEGGVVRAFHPDSDGMVTAVDIAADAPSAWEALIRRQINFFQDRGQSFEWKTWAHDHSPAFCQLLRTLGFVPGEQETVLIAPTATVTQDAPALPAGAELRVLLTDRDFDRLGEQLALAFGEGHRVHARQCRAAVAAYPDLVAVLGVDADFRLVASGRLEMVGGTDFACLWGGSVVPAWRRQGLYRALVVRRAELAARAGYEFLQVDALPTSRPILEAMGFTAVTTTTPFTWSP